MNCLYLTSADMTIETGDGVVTKHECEALHELGWVTVLGKDDIHPTVYKQPYSPFLFDYFASIKINRPYDLCHIYGGPYPLAVEKLKRDGCTVSITIPAHDRKTSIEEHEKLFGEYPFHHVKDPYLWSLHVRYMNAVDSIVCPSTRSKRILEEEGVETPITVIPHGTEIPDTVAPLPDDFTVAYLGVVGPDKGLIYLLRAWSQLDYDDAELVLAGSGTEQLSPMIQHFTEHGKYHLLGRVDNIRDVFDNCSVYVQPSTNEGFGITALEAMAHGRPVIVSDGAGSSDCVNHRFDGFIVRAGNVEDLVDKIRYFKTNQKKIQELGENARETAKQYSWETSGVNMSDTLIKLFNPILEVGGGDMPTFRPNMDIRPLPTVDIVANLEERFPIADESYGTIYGYYLLEHLSWRSLPLFISECHRVIKPGGSAVFTVPNTLAQCKRAASTKAWTLEISSLLFGGQDYSDNAHKNALSPEYAIRMFKEGGFHDVIIHEHPVSDTDMIIEARKSAAVIRIG